MSAPVSKHPRRIYLIRHAMPDIPFGERWCVGARTDLPLGPLGRLQAALLPFCPALRGLNAVFCSSLVRAQQTAIHLLPPARVMPGLEEQDMGEWDGLSFREIRARFPALYAARERDPQLLPIGAEPIEAVSARVREALLRCLEESEGDIAVVSHKSAIASQIGQREALDYIAVSAIDYADGMFSLALPPRQPRPPFNDALCLAMLQAAGLKEETIAHCQAVAALALELCEALCAAGLELDRDQVRAAALLHDIARGQPDHPQTGALWLRALGCPEIAELVRQHHDLDAVALDEAGLVYLADKAVQGTERIGLRKRFAQSEKKCATPEALAAHARRKADALALCRRLEAACPQTTFNLCINTEEEP